MTSSSSTSRLALVTGANRGIGLAIARGLAEAQGLRVILASRQIDAGAAAAEQIKGDCTPVALDLADPILFPMQLETILSEFPEIDVLVNNAGVLCKAPILELTNDEITDSIAVHLTGPLALVRALAPGMIQRGYGRIVNVSSGWGSFGEGLEGPGAYGWTKAALNALTFRLSKDLPADAIKVNTMCPGWVHTRMGGDDAPRSPEEGADTAIWLATLPADGPTGGFFRDRKSIEW